MVFVASFSGPEAGIGDVSEKRGVFGNFDSVSTPPARLIHLRPTLGN
jgi:hypothetical protein